MKQISDECIKAIEESTKPLLHNTNSSLYALGMRDALLTPSIYTKADLVHVDDFKLPESFNSEPVLVILTNALKYLNNEQLENLLTMISQRIPKQSK